MLYNQTEWYNWFVPQQQHSCVANSILCMCSDGTALEMQV